MKTLLCVLLLTMTYGWAIVCNAQYYDPSTVQSLNNNMIGFMNMGATPYQASQYGNAAYINSEGHRILNQSMANINNQSAYSMALDNRLKYTRTFFDNRQLNMYYRDLETYQRQERVRLKRYGIYDREAIEQLYGIGR